MFDRKFDQRDVLSNFRSNVRSNVRMIERSFDPASTLWWNCSWWFSLTRRECLTLYNEINDMDHHMVRSRTSDFDSAQLSRSRTCERVQAEHSINKAALCLRSSAVGKRRQHQVPVLWQIHAFKSFYACNVLFTRVIFVHACKKLFTRVIKHIVPLKKTFLHM